MFSSSKNKFEIADIVDVHYVTVCNRYELARKVLRKLLSSKKDAGIQGKSVA